uniref:DUF7745 domain-containing protein n=1 Tax=Solanum tuberosum TaxID=4113 RepID=M1E1A0_SOLTU
MEITPTIEEIRDGIDTVGTGLERRVRKHEDILIPNKPTIEEITKWLGLRKDCAHWSLGSSIAFRDLYIKFGHTSFYANHNQEFRITFREWDMIRPLAFTIALLDLEKRRTRERWAHIFSELRKKDIQWMFDRFISKDAIVRRDKQLVLPLPGIWGIRPYAPIRVLRQFGRKQTTPLNAYYHIYVCDIGDDRVPEASEMLREWKKAVRMDKDTIAADRFNAGYDETYKGWLKDNLQGISFPVPNIYRSLEDKESKALIKLREVKKESWEMHNEFLRKQEEDKYTFEGVTQELESLKRDFGELNAWMESKKGEMRFEDWEEKGHRYDGYWLMIQYRLQHYMGQNK